MLPGTSGIHGEITLLEGAERIGFPVILKASAGGGGRGMKIVYEKEKLLDAWAMGKAIVSTTAGAEGLGGADGQELLLADDPDAFADSVIRVLSDAPLRARLGAGGRAAVESRFSWQVIGRRMSDLYRGVAGLNNGVQ